MSSIPLVIVAIVLIAASIAMIFNTIGDATLIPRPHRLQQITLTVATSMITIWYCWTVWGLLQLIAF